MRLLVLSHGVVSFLSEGPDGSESSDDFVVSADQFISNPDITNISRPAGPPASTSQTFSYTMSRIPVYLCLTSLSFLHLHFPHNKRERTMSSTSSLSVNSDTLEHLTKDDLLNLKAGIFDELEKYAGKVNLCVDLDAEYRACIHTIQKSDAHSPRIQEIEHQIQGLDAVAVKAREKYLDAREKLKKIQTALETRFPTDEQAEKEERMTPTVRREGGECQVGRDEGGCVLIKGDC